MSTPDSTGPAGGRSATGPRHTPLDLPIADGGTVFIQASAGTGKTHALTTLVARLVVEDGLELERILVVTFTRAATAELRERIRRTLRNVLHAAQARAADAPAPVEDAASDAAGPQSTSWSSSTPGGSPSGAAGQPATAAASGAPGIGTAAVTVSAAAADRAPAPTARTDTQAQSLLDRWGRECGIAPATAARRLESAMHDIDRAGVYTIHGFCRRVLADLAFESGFPFGFEVGAGDRERVAGAVRDFWRRRLYPASTLRVRHAVDGGFLPEKVAEWVSTRRSKTDAEIAGGDPIPPGALDEAEVRWRETLEAARALWGQHGDAFRYEVLQGDWLNRGRYRAQRVERELAGIEAMLAAPDARLPEEGLAGRYGAQSLSQACRKDCAVPGNPLFDAFDGIEDASQALRSVLDRWLRRARREVLDEARASIRRRIRDDRHLGYDDLLIELDEALDGAAGRRLASRIRHEFPCALIDEYQDTDPLQARVFARVYGDLSDEFPDLRARQSRARSLGESPGESRGARRVDASRYRTESDADDTGDPGNDGDTSDAGDNGGTSDTGNTSDNGDAGDVADAGRVRRATLFVVGDPKQSIYRFRGADVFAYLAARGTARERIDLDCNRRSTPALVEGVNAIFAAADPFATSAIEYRPARAALDGGNPLRTGPKGDGPPLRFRLLPCHEDGKFWTKERAGPVVAVATAREIARLLRLAASGDAVIGDALLTGADIAVLVRTRAQGRLMADALREHGVRSVEIDDGSVFDTREAEHLERLLWALAEPGRGRRVRGALAGDLFGLDASELLAIGEDETAWTRWTERLAAWRSEWASRGIGALLLRLLEREGGAERLLRYRDGARRLTNVRHLAELLQETETREHGTPVGLATWLSRRRIEPGRGEESHQLRLESDEQLVRVLTMHGCKGLEFPVVFCPFAWDARRPPGSADTAVDAMYHRGEADGFRAVIDLDPGPQARDIERVEEFSESVRLLYVALTRAKYRCVVAWGQVSGAGHAPLAWLLHRSGAAPDAAPAGIPDTAQPSAAIDALDATAERYKALGAPEWIDEVEAHARCCPNGISVTVLAPDAAEAPAPAPPPSPPPTLVARQLGRPLRAIRSLTSFTALAAEAFVHGARPDRLPAGDEATEVDRPDHDQHEAPAGAPGPAPGAEGAERERSAFTFPRGPVAGSCLHRIFERLDEISGGVAGRPVLDAVCDQALDEFGIDRTWSPIARAMVERTRTVRLHELEPTERDTPKTPGRERGSPGGAHGVHDVRRAGGFRLGDPARRLVELEFHFPVEGLDRARLSSRLVEHGYPDPFVRADGATGAPSPSAAHGFLRGYIDLVVEHDARWYVLDYKSNWLGPRPDDYAPGALEEAMRVGNYTLQALIYLVALHRHLALRLPGYQYERHMGGAFYLFLRGIDPTAGMRRGVHFERPTLACLHAIDDCFRGRAA